MRAGLGAAIVLILAAGLAAPLTAARAADSAAADSPAAAPAKDTLTIDTTRGYARLLFSSDRPFPVSASIADGVLTIRTARVLDTSVDTILEKLGPVLASGRRDDDGLTYRFALKAPLALHSSTQGNRTAVDLVPDSYKGVPPDLPAPPPPPKKEAVDLTKIPVIKVRVGEYANFTRLVFDWPANVTYMAYPGQGRISIRFETLAKPDFSMLETRSPPWVKSAGWHIDNNATVVEFETDPDSRFHDFRDGTKIAIDVLAPKTDGSVYAPPGIAAAPAPIVPKALLGPAPKGSDAAAVKQAAGGETAGPTPTANPTPAPPPSLQASAELTRDGAVLHFPAARGKAVAVFSRGDVLWIVLDGQPLLDPATLLAPLSSQLANASADANSGALVMRLAFRKPLLASVSESDLALNVTLSAGAAAPPDAIALMRQGAEGQTTLTASLPGAAHAITLADSNAGDHLIVVPGRPGKGMLTPKRFLEMQALASSAGLAAIPYTDDLAVKVQDETVTFSRPQGLALSASSGASAQPVVQTATSKLGPAYIDFVQWAGGGSNVYQAERALRAAVARLPEADSNKGRLNLAHFLIAHELAPEALGELRLIQSADPKLDNDPSLNALKGAAQFMMGRYGDARTSLSNGPLIGDAHAALWRGMAEAKMGDWANARHDLAMSQSVLRFYPEEWRTRARLARAETGIAQGDLASANDALDQLTGDMSKRDQVEAKLYGAQLLAAQGHVNEAVSRLRILEQTDYTPIAVKATYARIDTQLSTKRIKPEQAIDTLEQMRFRWRGDDLELKILRKLGSLYFAQQRWREGLDVLRIAAVNFPNADLAREAQDDMRQAFSDLFLGGKADTIAPVQALGLYYDFIELTPIGRDGDEMIRRLADRLVAVDLLGPAEQLLDHQVRERLDGVARAVVATKLAMIYLLDHKPKDALAAINDTRESRLPDEIDEQRRLLEARALAGLKQFDQAMDLVADDESADAKRLRADIAWDSGDWKTAGAKAEEALGESWNGTAALSAQDRSQVMRAAVAYSLGADDASLARIKTRFAAKMNASPDAKAFAVVTDRIENQGVAFRDLAKQIASVDTLTAFMADFKKQEQAAKTASN